MCSSFELRPCCVLLLTGGSVLHHGTIKGLRCLLAAASLQLPPHVDTVEFDIDSVDELRAQQRSMDYHLQQARPLLDEM
jgi:hypothetical protein